MSKARICNPVAKASLAPSVPTMSLGVTLIQMSCMKLSLEITAWDQKDLTTTIDTHFDSFVEHGRGFDNIENLSDSLDIITTACPMSRLIRPLQLLVKFDTLLKKKKVISITAQLTLVSSEALALYKDVLSPALQQGYRHIIKAMKEPK
ncbi:unnamed protein product [Umbelopsis ramanniana]